MKAITVCQPFAELIARGDKRVENRRWDTRYRGLIAIHAGKSREWIARGPSEDVDGEFGLPIAPMAFGAVVAVADLVGCVWISEDRKTTCPTSAKRMWPWLLGDLHAEGPFCWVLENVRRFCEPIPATGALKIWDWDAPEDWESLLES